MVDIYPIIKDYNDITLSVDNKTVTFQDSSKSVFKVIICVEDNKLVIKDTDIYHPPSIHLANIIKAQKFTDINSIIDLLDFIKENIDKVKNYCVGCYSKLNYQTNNFCTCGEDKCIYKYEELRFGNPVIEKYKQNDSIFRLILTSSIDAILCPRKYDIFEPFPTYFLKDKDINIKRGDVSKLTNEDFDRYKDFDTLTSLVTNFDIDKFMYNILFYTEDNEIEQKYSKDLYILIRFLVMSCKIELNIDTSFDTLKNSKNILMYKINSSTDQEKQFEDSKKLDNSNKTSYLFHGSNWYNWYSIMRNGLKNCSKTKLMTAGAAYGNGIYLSDNIQLSYGYGLGNASNNNKNRSIVGVFELVGDKEKYSKSNNIFVVDNEKLLILRYFIIIDSIVNIINLNSIFNTDIYVSNTKTVMTSTSKAVKKLTKEYMMISKLDIGIKVDIDDENVYKWSAYITGYDTKYPIGQDMELYKIKEIELEILFNNTYPFSPPFIRVVKPRFKHLSGHVTSDGALCMEILTGKGWSPACSLESLLVTIRSEIIEGDGRLDPVKYNVPYSFKEAQESFNRVAKGHGWM